jgi:hypothetical protein
MCAAPPGSWGTYFISLSRTLVREEVAAKEDAELQAISNSWKIDQALPTRRRSG